MHRRTDDHPVRARPPELDGHADEVPRVADIGRALLDHASEIVRDAVSMGALEVKRAAADLLPRVAIGLVAFALGAIGFCLAAIAIFIALGGAVPSVAARLAIFAGVLIALAALAAIAAAGRLRRPSESSTALSSPRALARVTSIREGAPIAPVESVKGLDD